MGEYADYEIDRMMGLDDDEEADEYFSWGKRHQKNEVHRKGFQRGVGKFNWRQADGTIVAMVDMTDEHLKNAIDHCDRYGNTAKAKDMRTVLEIRQQSSDSS